MKWLPHNHDPSSKQRKAGKGRVIVLVLPDQVWVECFLSEVKLRLQ